MVWVKDIPQNSTWNKESDNGSWQKQSSASPNWGSSIGALLAEDSSYLLDENGLKILLEKNDISSDFTKEIITPSIWS